MLSHRLHEVGTYELSSCLIEAKIIFSNDQSLKSCVTKPATAVYH